ncbi:hypothetical protein ACFLZG_04810 [Thermodesulfobacteriota bacterium]
MKGYGLKINHFVHVFAILICLLPTVGFGADTLLPVDLRIEDVFKQELNCICS